MSEIPTASFARQWARALDERMAGIMIAWR